MAVSNRDRIGKALELLTQGLKPFVNRELASTYKNQWRSVVKQEGADPSNMDAYALLKIMRGHWNEVFKNVLGNTERTIVHELYDVRNEWAHQGKFSYDDAYRALDSVERLLRAVSAPDQAAQVEALKQDLRVRWVQQEAAEQVRRQSLAPIRSRAAGGLKPWREVVTPHPDVASGRFNQAEFAADLGQVHRGDATTAPEYRDPGEFFSRTYLTEGLRRLLVEALRRLSGQSAAPVVELQTNFGGGKTHSMLALYHMLSGEPAESLPGLEAVLQEAEVAEIPKARRVVLVGQALSPGQPQRKSGGVEVRTLWGELAWQLDGQESYELIRQADETGTSPGDALRELLALYAPCIILIDEWVAYARQLYMKEDLPGGNFDAHFTFAQALTEAAKAVPGVMVVASLPASDIEIGGEGGKAALERLRNALGRVQSPWRPASAEESFEIVRRRLFQPLETSHYAARDAVVQAFGDMYRKQSSEFPSNCREPEYERRMAAAYPIHPELFDRLYTDWSSLEKFQRTRGVLRLMAAVIHVLWERGDPGVLIMPATVPVDDPTVQHELTRYLDDHWVPVIGSDVDGPNSTPLKLDNDNPNLGRFSACRRVARTVYLGSAPTYSGPNPGIDDTRIKLGCAQPGEALASFGDALRRLSMGAATYLYADGQRYWYSPVPSVASLARERAARCARDRDALLKEIRDRLDKERTKKGSFAKVHICPESPSDVPDEDEARLVILDPQYPHTGKAQNSAALEQARAILDQRSGGAREKRNTLVFLAADETRLRELEDATCHYLAWTSIEHEKESLNLNAFQTRQATTNRKQADETVTQRVPETYQWLLVPVQDDPQGQMRWEEIRLQSREPLAERASKKLVAEELLLTSLAGSRLRYELDRIPLWRGDDVQIEQLLEDFAKYLYLSRVQGPAVLLAAVREGLNQLTWGEHGFAYARARAADGRYEGLVAGQLLTMNPDATGLLVKAEVAAEQIAADQERTKAVAGQEQTVGDQPAMTTEDETKEEERPAGYLRFFGVASLNPQRAGRDAGQIADEVIQHLVGLQGANVRVTLEIQADFGAPVPDDVVRTVSENCRVLGFDQQGFEEG